LRLLFLSCLTVFAVSHKKVSKRFTGQIFFHFFVFFAKLSGKAGF